MRALTYRTILVGLFFVTCLVLPLEEAKANKSCVWDIFSAGISIDGLAYKVKKDNDSYVSVASRVGYGTKANWIIFCPGQGIEYSPYLRLRMFEFKKSQETGTGPISGEHTLPSVGFEGKKILSDKFEIPLDLEIREEIGIQQDISSRTLYDFHYTNLKLISGIRYFLWSKGKRDVTAVGKLGGLIPIAGETDQSMGFIYGLSLEYFQKMGKNYSLRSDLYYDFHQQELDGLKNSRKEFGLRINVVFRP